MDDINIALLIDADNISSRYITGILSELSKYGKITVRRMYGDWSQDRLHGWLKSSSRYSLTPVMQPNNTPGKNASDIGLIIDAMDILYTGDVQGFCIVSSDGDFNKLATRLREAGKVVIGMGETKTPESFRVSCERFIFLNIVDDDNAETEDASKTKSKSSRRKSATAKKSRAAAAETAEVPPAVAEPSAVYDAEDSEEASFTDKATIEDAIVKMITDNNVDGKETGLGEIGSRLVKIFPDFDIRNYHYTKLSEYLKDFPSLSVANRDNAVWVSLKSSPDSEIETQIARIFERNKTREMDIGQLKSELQDLNPSLNATIRKSGVTRFSVYLNRMIHSVEVNGSRVTLL
ncbi:MAG: NYN domain-containing protein [Lachnospiraceae bacterium]|nr:NYN domain-containing protein [Lachnospiraceae bacterium]